MPGVNPGPGRARHTGGNQLTGDRYDHPRVIPLLEAAVDAVLDTVAGDIVMGLPLAIGKPNPFVNALYRRMKANLARRLTDHRHRAVA